MQALFDLWNAVFPNLVSEFLVVVAGILFTLSVRKRIEEKRYGNWRVVVRKGGEALVDRAISPRKAHEIAEESADLSVYLKGVVSPYSWIKCDLIEHGEGLGLLRIDRSNRRYIIDLDKNPEDQEQTTSSATLDGRAEA